MDLKFQFLRKLGQENQGHPGYTVSSKPVLRDLERLFLKKKKMKTGLGIQCINGALAENV